MRIEQIERPLPRERRGPGIRLREQLVELAGGRAEVLSHEETAWASVTFAGTRHRLALAFEGTEAIAAGEAFIALLPEHEFAIRGQLVADATVPSVDHRLSPEPRLVLTCELLLLDDE